ncbi:uncharacterized protein LTR77_008650 [Saxophila tyrrhenica]|uniref:Uncharacterized protein n=1 Tax=Saxophila tyrrhenica TaxID=1690608 RepID=A0AAV9P090_9PEZI|nr:hypothetical protein LTR77_008650 [Saxophila tyrrhenica]
MLPSRIMFNNTRNPVPLLRLATILAAVLTFILMGIAYSQQEYFFTSSPGSSTDAVVFAPVRPFSLTLTLPPVPQSTKIICPQAAYTLLYSTPTLLLHLLRGPHPYHPGIDIPFDFIGWGLGWAMGCLLLATNLKYKYPSNEDYPSGDGRVIMEGEVLKGVEIAGAVFAVVVGAVDVRRKSEKAAKKLGIAGGKWNDA